MEILDLISGTPALQVFIAGLLGVSIGSFLNVVIHRLPLMMYKDWSNQCKEIQQDKFMAQVPEDTISLSQPRSRCPSCKSPILAIQNIPLFSYLFLRGKCANCGIQITPRYFLIEAICGGLAIFIVARYGLSITTLFYLLFTFLLIPLVFIDIDHQLLPDEIVYLLLWSGVIFSLSGHGINLEESIYGILTGYLSLWFIYHAFKLVTGKEGMGYGDFKLFAALGAWVGVKLLLPVILIASLSGTLFTILQMVTNKRDLQSSTTIPFGPYLALGGWITLFWGDTLMKLYLSSF